MKMGQCTSCGQWNTLRELRLPSSSAGKLSAILSKETSRSLRSASQSSHGTLIDLSSAEVSVAERIQLWSREVNNVFGGGLVRGSVVLIAGDPGVGKSTLLLQLSSSVADSSEEGVVYLSGEENADQILSRVNRLRLPSKNIRLLCDTDVDAALNTLVGLPVGPALVIVDSIQMMRTQSGGGLSTAGSVSQIRDCTALLVEFAKTSGTSVVLVGHVTKNGEVAGPRVLEHMVDTVLYLEASEGRPSCRLLRCIKNRYIRLTQGKGSYLYRFGTTDEVGVLAMEPRGLVDVTNPSEMFMSNSVVSEGLEGSAVAITLEGTR